MTAVEQELMNPNTNAPDIFVARSQHHVTQGVSLSGHGAGAAGSSGGGGGGGGAGVVPGGKVAYFYLQVLVESFAKDLPSARRGQEQLAALAGAFGFPGCKCGILLGREFVSLKLWR